MAQRICERCLRTVDDEERCWRHPYADALDPDDVDDQALIGMRRELRGRLPRVVGWTVYGALTWVMMLGLMLPMGQPLAELIGRPSLQWSHAAGLATVFWPLVLLATFVALRGVAVVRRSLDPTVAARRRELEASDIAELAVHVAPTEEQALEQRRRARPALERRRH